MIGFCTKGPRGNEANSSEAKNNRLGVKGFALELGVQLLSLTLLLYRQ
jgi:hypothetical protein